jgi:Uma2 family endonuclease
MTATDIRLWTVKEYRRMTETGILDPDERVELIDRQIISMSAKTPPHAATNLCAANYLRNLL